MPGDGSNYAGGFDANFGFFNSVNFIGYWAKTGTSKQRRSGVPVEAVHGNDTSYRGRFDYGADRVGVQLEHIAIGSQFNPEVGYVKRGDFRRTFADVRYSQRTRKSRTIRRLNFDTSLDYIENAARTLVENKEQKTALGIEFHNSDQFKADYRTDYELLPKAFTIATGVTVPRGGYQYGSFNTSYSLGQQRLLSGQVTASIGTFYEGTKRSLGLNNAYLALNRHDDLSHAAHHGTPAHEPHGDHADTPNAHQQPRAIQQRVARPLNQRAAQLGISAQQPVLCRLQRRP